MALISKMKNLELIDLTGTLFSDKAKSYPNSSAKTSEHQKTDHDIKSPFENLTEVIQNSIFLRDFNSVKKSFVL